MSLLMANRALIKTVGGSPFPPVIEDGNSVGWYIGDDLSTITKDASDFMSEWRDYLGSGHNLLQALGSNQPKWVLNDGVLFDGIDNFMKAVAFTYNQPEQIYIVFKQITWTQADYIHDGNSSFTGILTQSGTTPELVTYAGTVSPNNPDLAIGVFGVVTALYDGANSFLQVNNETPITGDIGNLNMNGYTLGTQGAGGANFGNFIVKEILLRSIADTVQSHQDIKNYLAAKYSI